MGSWAPSRLRIRHGEILRLAFQGLSNNQIAAQVGASPATVSCVLRSPVAKAELARMAQKAEESLTDVPAKVRVMAELNGFGIEAMRLRRQLMNDNGTDLRIREKISGHIMDRVLFNKDAEGDGGSIRDVLRRLDEVRDAIKNGEVQRAPVVIDVGAVAQEEETA